MEQLFARHSPIYLQLKEIIKLRIISREWNKGQRIPSVRELSMEFEVNPNTMQRALSELEREKILYSERTSGRFITNDEGVLNTLKQEMLKKYVDEFMDKIRKMGYTRQTVIDFISQHDIKEEE